MNTAAAWKRKISVSFRLRYDAKNLAGQCLSSDNVVYAAQFVAVEEVREVWEAVGRLTRQFANPRFDIPNELARQRADIGETLERLRRIEGELHLPPSL